eukprot:gene12476-15683_t
MVNATASVVGIPFPSEEWGRGEELAEDPRHLTAVQLSCSRPPKLSNLPKPCVDGDITMNRASTALRVLILVAFAFATSLAYPEDYAKKSSTKCDSNPNRGYGKHGAPQEDGSMAFAMLEFDEVTFPLSGAEAYMTASSGEFGNPFKSSCPNQVVAAAGADFVGKEYVDSYIVDCSETGNVTITVTWSRTKTDNYHQSSITLPVNATCMLEYCSQASVPTPDSPYSPPGMNEDNTGEDEDDSEEMEGEGTNEEGEDESEKGGDESEEDKSEEDKSEEDKSEEGKSEGKSKHKREDKREDTDEEDDSDRRRSLASVRRLHQKKFHQRRAARASRKHL